MNDDPVLPCTLCARLIAPDEGRYFGECATGYYRLCQGCGEKIADQQGLDPEGSAALVKDLLLSAAKPQGSA